MAFPLFKLTFVFRQNPHVQKSQRDNEVWSVVIDVGSGGRRDVLFPHRSRASNSLFMHRSTFATGVAGNAWHPRLAKKLSTSLTPFFWHTLSTLFLRRDVLKGKSEKTRIAWPKKEQRKNQTAKTNYLIC